MKIAIVTPWFPNRVNPASGTFVLKDAVCFRNYGHEVTIFHLVPPHEHAGDEPEQVEEMLVHRIPMSTSNPLSIARAAMTLKPMLEGFDILHTQALSAIEPFIFFRPQIPWIHTEHWSGITTPDTLLPLQRALLPTLLRLSRLPDVVVAVCEFLARPLRDQRGTKPVVVIPCQVPSPARLVERPEPTDVLRLISTGALVDRKDPLLAVRTLAALKERGVRASLTWLGSGPLQEEAISLAQELGVDASFPGVKSAEEVRDALAQADMFFGPTKADNFFVAAAESIVNGRPLVVGANGGQGEYIAPTIGATVEVRDPHAYADAIIDVAERTAGMSAAEIASTVQGRFEPEEIARLYTRHYQALVNAKEAK